MATMSIMMAMITATIIAMSMVVEVGSWNSTSLATASVLGGASPTDRPVLPDEP